MTYEFRHRKLNTSYVDSSSSESDSRSSDPDYSRSRSRRATKRSRGSRSRRRTTRNTTLYSPRAQEIETVNSKVEMSARLSKKRAERDQNKATTDAGASSSMKRGSFSGEGPSSIMEIRSSSTEGPNCLKKTILSWLIDCKIIEEGEQVCYINGTKESATKRGRITRSGILCDCCQWEMSVWAFEKHAGSDLKHPYQHIYLLKTGTCLLDCQAVAWHESREQRRRELKPFVPKENATDKNDDACLICGDGGDLICCDKCPSTFHPHCMNMEIVPQGDWLCPYCVCKYCGLGSERYLLVTCSQCDKKFHGGCFLQFLREAPKEAYEFNCPRLYCGRSCREIYEKMESLVGVRNELDESYGWRVIRPMDVSPPSTRHHQMENNLKVAVAWTLMNESFETIKDRHTRINVIQSVLYSRGSDLTRINFSRFYTFILEKDDEIICAASIRIHGRRVAEMPFIATAKSHRGQGFCSILMTIVESNLCRFNVEALIIPSAEETSEIWLYKYGFKELTSDLKRDIASFNILTFPFAVRLQKDLIIHTAESDGGEGNKDEQTINQNVQEPEKDAVSVKRPLPDLNLEPPDED